MFNSSKFNNQKSLAFDFSNSNFVYIDCCTNGIRIFESNQPYPEIFAVRKFFVRHVLRDGHCFELPHWLLQNRFQYLSHNLIYNSALKCTIKPVFCYDAKRKLYIMNATLVKRHYVDSFQIWVDLVSALSLDTLCNVLASFIYVFTGAILKKPIDIYAVLGITKFGVR